MPALSGRYEALPVGNCEVHRRERARTQDRARDNDAGRRLLIDDQVRANTQNGRLQQHPQDLRCRSKSYGDVAAYALAGKISLVRCFPACGQSLAMPMATMASALRRLVSASPCR